MNRKDETWDKTQPSRKDTGEAQRDKNTEAGHPGQEGQQRHQRGRHARDEIRGLQPDKQESLDDIQDSLGEQ